VTALEAQNLNGSNIEYTNQMNQIKPRNLALDETQWSLWRAVHAHAGVYVILALIFQPLVDQTASLVVPIGLFGLAFVHGFRWIMYIGIVCLTVSMLLTGIGLLWNLRPVVQ
jgi:cbb3-type cytochrome oxidase subunit 1